MQQHGKGNSRLSFKDWVDVAQAVFTIGAILAAGIWFYEQHSSTPRIKLDQSITQRTLAGTPGFYLIAVDVRATNIGRVRVHLSKGMMGLTQINPVPGEALLPDTPLKDLVLDPGEGDQALFKTFIVPDSIRTIEVVSRYGVPDEKNYFWQLESAADLGSSEPLKTTMSGPQ